MAGVLGEGPSSKVSATTSRWVETLARIRAGPCAVAACDARKGTTSACARHATRMSVAAGRVTRNMGPFLAGRIGDRQSATGAETREGRRRLQSTVILKPIVSSMVDVVNS